MSSSRPWFKFFPADWLGSRETRFLSAAQRGYLIQLMAEAWRSEPAGSLPADPDQIWRLAGAKSRKQFETHAKAVLEPFNLQNDRYWHQGLLSQYRRMEGVAEERRLAGTNGAKQRWQNDGKPMANATASAKQTDGDVDVDLDGDVDGDRDGDREAERDVDRDRDGAADSDAEAREDANPALPASESLSDRTRATFQAKAMPAPLSPSSFEEKKLELKRQAVEWKQRHRS